MKPWGLRALSLSAITKLDVGQDSQLKYLNTNVLYIVLPSVNYYQDIHKSLIQLHLML